MPALISLWRRTHPTFHCRSAASSRRSRVDGFTLAELLAVITIIAVLVALTIPAMNAIKGGRDITRAAYDVAGALELARTYAQANNTYVWVGFYEEDGSKDSTNPATPGIGRVIVSLVASKDGGRYINAINTVPPAFGAPSGTVALTQFNKLLKIEGAHLASLNDPSGTANTPARPPVLIACQVGDAPGTAPNNSAGVFARTALSPGGNTTTFTYLVPPTATQQTSNPQYTFAKIIEFNPQGEASKITENTYGGAGLPNYLEIALQPARGNVVDPRYSGANASRVGAAVQVEGLTGQVKVYRP